MPSLSAAALAGVLATSAAANVVAADAATDPASPNVTATHRTGCRHLPGINCDSTRNGIQVEWPLGRHSVVLGTEHFHEREQVALGAGVGHPRYGHLRAQANAAIQINGQIAKLGWRFPLSEPQDKLKVRGELGAYFGHVTAHARADADITLTLMPQSISTPAVSYRNITIPGQTFTYNGGAYVLAADSTEKQKSSKMAGIHQALSASYPLNDRVRLEFTERGSIAADRFCLALSGDLMVKTGRVELGIGVYAEKVERDHLYRAKKRQSEKWAARINGYTTAARAEIDQARAELPGIAQEYLAGRDLPPTRQVTPQQVADALGWVDTERTETALRLQARLQISNNVSAYASYLRPQSGATNLSRRTEIGLSVKF